MKRTSNEGREWSSIPGGHAMDYVPALGMWEKNILFGVRTGLEEATG